MSPPTTKINIIAVNLGDERLHYIALTGYALPEDLKRALEVGFQRHLAKPVNVAKLEQILEGAGRAKHEAVG